MAPVARVQPTVRITPAPRERDRPPKDYPSYDPFGVVHARALARDGEPSARYTPPPLIRKYEERFWSRVARPAMDWVDTPVYHRTCWLWTGFVRADGQAFFTVSSKPIAVQRFAYTLQLGPVLDGFTVRAECEGGRLCCSPLHIGMRTTGTQPDKVPDSSRERIRELHTEQGFTMEWVARKCGISLRTANRICGDHDD